ncbi:MAG: PTS system mannose/fructose/sorbose family transporter subunit IID [candidate division WOR-3 bacterium]|nr:PTS system mannose/fructose/sorbose family transporter subunit IID [candidate division WOR-3 bacterium]
MHIGIFRLIRLFLASLFLQSSWSFHSLQSLGFLVTVMGGIDRKKRKFLLQNGRFFFNTHPYMAGFIIGAVLRGIEQENDFESLKKHIMVSQSAFASFGDTFFWHTIRPGLSIMAVLIGLKCGVLGPLLFLVIYNLIHLFFRFYGFIAGYERGWDVVFVLKEKRFLVIQQIFEALGALVTGLLPLILIKNMNALFIIPLSGIFLVFLWKKVAPILILTFVFILVIINLILL